MAEQQHKCAQCGEPIESDPSDNPWRPFCSRRCQLLDLSKWLDEDYRIPGRHEPNAQEREE